MDLHSQPRYVYDSHSSEILLQVDASDGEEARSHIFHLAPGCLEI